MPHIPRLIIPITPIGGGGQLTSRAEIKPAPPLSPLSVSPTWTEGRHNEEDPCPDLSPVATRSPRPGSSCYALRAAVANLTFWDDFEAEKIGSGFFSDVYKIRHHGNGNIMVVKISKSRNDRINQQKMLQELELLNKLSHPNVVRYMGACVKDGHIHPLLEYISGGSLEDVLKDQEVSLSWQQKASLATDIARGMEYLHCKNVCHRDLKSENCLLRKLPGNKLEAVVADFGLARVLKIDENDPTPHQESPRRMSLVGSPYWMAPEILRGEEYTKTVDVFSFGIILCEIMARIPADPDDLPRTSLFGLDVDGFRKLCPGCPESMLQLAADCCSMDPTERPSFTEIYLRLCFINHQMSPDEMVTANQSHSEIETQNQNGTIPNGDCSTTNNNQELDVDRQNLENESYVGSNNVDNCESISSKPTTHVSNSRIQMLAPGVMANTSRILRAVYLISAICVLATLVAVLNFWQHIFTLLYVLVPLTIFTLYPMPIPHWWKQYHVTFKVSGLLYDLGRRLSWSNVSLKKRRIGVSGIDMSELKSKISRDQEYGQNVCNVETHVNGAGNNQENYHNFCNEDTHVNGAGMIDSKHDTFSVNNAASLNGMQNAMTQNQTAEIIQTMPKVLRTRRRLSRTLIRTGSFGCHDSIEEHDDES